VAKTNDKRQIVFDLISRVRKLKINVACISEIKILKEESVFPSSSLKCRWSCWQNQQEFYWIRRAELPSRVAVQ